MIRILLGITLVALAYGQTTFEAASVKPVTAESAKSAIEGRAGVVFSPGSVTMSNVTLKTVITSAYGVKAHQVSGPAWINSERYDVIGKSAGPAADGELRQMLQQLLAERFSLSLHRETKDLPVYVLTAGKNTSKLHESAADTKSGTRGEGSNMVFQHYSMAQLSDFLSRLRSVGRPVLDMTGLSGDFDFTVEVMDSNPENMADAKRGAEQAVSDPGFAARVASQLGLKLEARTAPADILVIDRVEKATEN
jgi:uncharacterized protein (TIGR03435 family)